MQADLSHCWAHMPENRFSLYAVRSLHDSYEYRFLKSMLYGMMCRKKAVSAIWSTLIQYTIKNE